VIIATGGVHVYQISESQTIDMTPFSESRCGVSRDLKLSARLSDFFLLQKVILTSFRLGFTAV
jgi:hypothetical protein